VSQRMLQLRLLLRRSKLVSLTIDAATRRICTELVGRIFDLLQAHADEVDKPSSFRYFMAWSLGEGILTAACLLCANDAARDQSLVDGFASAADTLELLAAHLPAAERVHNELSEIIRIVRTRIMPLDPFSIADGALPNFPDDFDQLLHMSTAAFTPFQTGPDPSYGISPGSDGPYYFNQTTDDGFWNNGHGSFMSGIRMA
jgi:hypothetical protein